MFFWFRYGHFIECPRSGSCQCSVPWRYLQTGVLALGAAALSAWIGFGNSMALFSELPHAFVDGATDFLTFALFLWYGREYNEGRWHHVQAGMLLLGVLGIVGSLGFRLIEAAKGAPYPVDGPYTITGSGLGLLILLWRVRILAADRDAMGKLHNGVYQHAVADVIHMVTVVAVGVILTILQLLGLKALMVLIDALVTAFLSVRLTRIALNIARGEGCCGHGDDHGHDHAH